MLASLSLMDTTILFDLDRTLVDVQTFTDYQEALTDVEGLIGRWDDVATPETDWDRPTHRCMSVLVGLSGDPRWSIVSDAIERLERAAVTQSAAMPGLAEAYRRTAGRRRAVVTLLPASVGRAALDRHDAPIELVVGRQRSLRPKPAPDQLLAALEEVGGEAANAVMIGDSLWDAEAAAAASIEFIGVTNGSPSVFPSAARVVEELPAAVDLVDVIR